MKAQPALDDAWVDALANTVGFQDSWFETPSKAKGKAKAKASAIQPAVPKTSPEVPPGQQQIPAMFPPQVATSQPAPMRTVPPQAAASPPQSAAASAATVTAARQPVVPKGNVVGDAASLQVLRSFPKVGPVPVIPVLAAPPARAGQPSQAGSEHQVIMGPTPPPAAPSLAQAAQDEVCPDSELEEEAAEENAVVEEAPSTPGQTHDAPAALMVPPALRSNETAVQNLDVANGAARSDDAAAVTPQEDVEVMPEPVPEMGADAVATGADEEAMVAALNNAQAEVEKDEVTWLYCEVSHTYESVDCNNYSLAYWFLHALNFIYFLVESQCV